MINSLSGSFQALIDEWPEVFENLEINVIPVVYLNKVSIRFLTGMVWEVDIKNYLDDLTPDKIEDMLNELYDEYKDEIKGFEYCFDVEKLKKDLNTLSNKLL